MRKTELQQHFTVERSTVKDEDDGIDGSGSVVQSLPAGSPRWYELTRPLYYFLMQTSRGWPELLWWGHLQGLHEDEIRTLIAALDLRHEVTAIGKGSKVRWSAVIRKSRRTGKPIAAPY
jgi:hypothetical protein